VRGGIYTPQQKIFAKVKAVIWLWPAVIYTVM
jgi:hypothetical protein